MNHAAKFHRVPGVWLAAPLLLLALQSLALLPAAARAQQPTARLGEVVPRDVREMYDRGLQFLATTQTETGQWTGGIDAGPGGTGLGLMVFLASGEDPNFGLYSNNVRRALRSIISAQSADTGILGQSMYHHGFGMLALAEAYGTVDDRNLWTGSEPNRRSIGQALELAVRAAITSQKKNPVGAWRYSPDSRDADTSVSGAVLMGLLAARNAGIEVPDEVIDRAIQYFVSMTSPAGQVGYSGGFGGFGESLARTSIAALVYSISRRKDLPQFAATLQQLTSRLEARDAGWEDYARYYQSQALFQGDAEAWAKWNTLLIRTLKTKQNADGSFRGQYGPAFSTSMSLLALALNYRFLPIYER
jgi:hypothetical protein